MQNSNRWLIVGLGNPGPEYAKTRHNVGFRCLDLLAEKLGVRVDKAKFQGLYGQTDYHGNRLYLLKPLTYMNLSGRSVLQLSAFFQVPPQRIIVLFDDISLEPGRLRVRPNGSDVALPAGKLRIRKSGSAGGHNGIKSIIAELGSQEFPRVKLGVGAKPHPDFDLAAWVLSTFSAQEEKALLVSLENGAQAALTIIDQGTAAAANNFNGSHP